MSRRTIPTCRVLLKAIVSGAGHAKTEEYKDKIYCHGYQNSFNDDEPCSGCKKCHLYIGNIDCVDELIKWNEKEGEE